MARRTEGPTKEGSGPDQLPPSAPPTQERPFWLGWAALIIVIVVGVGLVVFLSTRPGGKPLPLNSAPPGASPSAPAPSVAPSLPAGVPATTYAAFAALPPTQQKAVMQEAIDNYSKVVAQAFRTLDPGLLPHIATGGELGVLQQELQVAVQNHQPQSLQSQASILNIVMSPQPYSFVSINVQGTGTDQDLDPTTLQPIGTPNTSTVTSSFSLVIEDGVWKVSQHIQEPTS
jgi:hypothetical protein